MNLALAARREERLESIAEELEAEYGADAVAVPTNVREEAAVEALIEATVEPGEASEPRELAEAIRFAATWERSGVSELDLFRRDKYADTFE